MCSVREWCKGYLRIIKTVMKKNRLDGTYIYRPVKWEATKGRKILSVVDPDFAIIIRCHDPHSTTALNERSLTVLFIFLYATIHCKLSSLLIMDNDAYCLH